MSKSDCTIEAYDLRKAFVFSTRTFGPGDRLKGVLDHIAEELEEVKADPKDVYEWVDVLILVFDGAMRQGITPYRIIMAYHEKMAKNMKRKWPDWRTQDPNKKIKAIKS